MNTTFLSNHFAMPTLACAALLTAGCSEKNAPQDQRMTNNVPLALDDELQNRSDGKWYWRDTSNLFAGIEIRHHPSGLVMRQLPMTNGVGGPVGPALDTIATRKQEDYILQSLVDPGATIAEGYVGKVSPMPPMALLLKPQELADVMAYIITDKHKKKDRKKQYEKHT